METNQIYLGDAYELIKQIPKDRTVILVTDPPFNIGYHYDVYSDNMKEDEYYESIATLIKACNGMAVIIHYPEPLHRLSMELKQAPLKVVSWVYNSNTPRQHRDIAYYGFKPAMKQVVQPYKNPDDKRIAERIKRGIVGGGVI